MDKIIFDRVGTRLKQARELRHITLEEAGKQVDVHKSTVLRWENGKTEKIRFPIIEILSEYYNVDPTWLMGYDVPMEKTFKLTNTTSSHFTIHNDAIKAIYGELALELLDNYSKLNDLGRQKASENIKDLTKINEYTEKKTGIQGA